MRFLRAVIALAAACTLALSLSPWLDLTSPAWIPPIQALIRVWAIAAVIGIVVALVARAWLSMTVFLVAALASALVIVNVNIADCELREKELSVLSLNTEFSSAPVDEVAEVISERKVDVVVLAEVHSGYIDELLSREDLAYLEYRSGSTLDEVNVHGTVILSRYPGTPFEVEQQASSFGQPGMEIEFDDRLVLIRAVHPKPPIREMMNDWRGGLDDLGKWQRSLPGKPLVMAGDFNASRAHPGFRNASQGMDFAAGRWAKATWPADRKFPAFTDIDHVLTREFASLNYEAMQFSNTDHKGIWTSLALCE